MLQSKREYLHVPYNVYAILRRPDHRLDNDQLAAIAAGRDESAGGGVAKQKLPSGVVSAAVRHNVLVNQGRSWLRNLCIASSLPALSNPPVGNESLAANSVLPSPGAAVPYTYRVRFVGLGTGGALQRYPGHPSATPGATFTEDVTRQGLERPVTITGTTADGNALWLRQIQMFDNLADPDLIPDAYTARCRAIFEEGEVTYTGSHDHNQVNNYMTGGAIVPISEAILCSSQAMPGNIPVEDGVTPVSGMLAYDPFVNQNKTPDVYFELVWDLLF